MEISGLQETQAMMERLTKGTFDDVFVTIHEEMMNAIMNRGMKEAPVRTGYLSASAYVDHMRTKTSFYVKGGFRADYASHVDQSHWSKSGFFSENVAIAMKNIDDKLREVTK
jgi:hypothetical protein